MHIVIVSQYFYPEHFEINAVARALSIHHQVTVLTGMPNYPSGRFYQGYGGFLARIESLDGIDILRSPMIARGSGSGLRLAINYLSYAVSASLLAFKLRKRSVDAILVFQPSPITVGFPALACKWLTGAPVWLWVQDLWPESLAATGAVDNDFVLRLVGQLVRFIYRRSDVILVPSRGFMASIRALEPSLRDVRYLPNSADAAAPIERAAPTGDGFRIVYGGNIGVAQDFETLLAAAEALRNQTDIEWLIAGDGRQRNILEQQIKDRGLESCVRLLPWQSQSQMAMLFSSADALFLGLRREDIFSLTVPSKVQAYLAAARPIIGCVEGEAARIVTEAGAGLVCPPGDSAALAESVLAFRHMPPSVREAMGVAGRQYFDREFAREMLIQRLNNWLMENRRL